jgi:hypothetical protein
MINRAAIAALAVFSGAASAQGYFDFAEVPGVGAEPQVQIDLNPALLGFVTEAMRATDPNTVGAFEGIRNVRVRVYESLKDSAAVLKFLEDSSGQLEREGWQRVVYIQEDDEKVRVYLMIENNRAVGLTVMVVDASPRGSGEAVFINVAGDIDPTKLGQLANSIGMGGILDSFGGAIPGTR